MKFYPPAVEAFQINSNDNTEMIEYFQRTIPDFDIIHAPPNGSPFWDGALLINGISYYFKYHDWVAESTRSPGIRVITNVEFAGYTHEDDKLW